MGSSVGRMDSWGRLITANFRTPNGSDKVVRNEKAKTVFL